MKKVDLFLHIQNIILVILLTMVIEKNDNKEEIKFKAIKQVVVNYNTCNCHQEKQVGVNR